MSGFVCMCASEDCQVNGCQRLRSLQTRYAQNPPFTQPVRDFGARVVTPITADEVRAIVREELRTALAELGGKA